MLTTVRGRARSALLAAVLLGSLGAGCAEPDRATQPPATPSPTPAGSAEPAGGEPSAPPPDLPPDAALLVPDGDPVVGQLGTFFWRGSGSDAPWLSGAEVAVSFDEPLLFGLSAAVPVEAWSAEYAQVVAPGAAVPRRVALPTLGRPLEVGPPPAGRWTVVLRLTFGDELGEAHYFWLVTVG